MTNKDRSLVIRIFLVLIVAGIAYLGFMLYSSPKADHNISSVDNPAQEKTVNTADPASLEVQPIKTYIITAKNFEFSESEIKVKLGDRIKVVLNIEEGYHDFVIDEFGVKTEKLEKGQSGSIEFIADKQGEYEYYCSIGTHRQMGMRGKLIVE